MKTVHQKSGLGITRFEQRGFDLTPLEKKKKKKKMT